MIDLIIKAIIIFNLVVGGIFFIFYFYQFVYLIIPFIKKPKAHKNEVIHNIGILISARNEENVIGQLIDSINCQDYPKENIKIFVVADNCDANDKTASIAKERGAIVYERQDKNNVGKGYALDFLLSRIKEDFGLQTVDAFIVLDADNLLDKGYVRAMNQTYCDGYKVTTSYRNSKNYGDNWLSAAYGLWFLREARFLNYSRFLLGTSCAVSGTGFLVERVLIEKLGGWKYFLLTEDIQFTTDCIVSGEIIGYCDEAVLYDEQPTTIKQSWRQRLRWSKGFFQVWVRYDKKLFRGILDGSWSCYDMTMTVCPAFLISLLSIIFDIIGIFIAFLAGPAYYHYTSTLGLIILGSVGEAYILFFIMALVTLITEWRSINCRASKKISYIFMFPLFLITYMPIALQALFKKVEWKPIAHTKSVTLDDVIGKNKGDGK